MRRRLNAFPKVVGAVRREAWRTTRSRRLNGWNCIGYLLRRLEERRFNDVRAEIEAAAAAPLIEESPEDQVRVSKLVRGEVRKAVIRRREPKEVFNAAVDVLSVGLIELPALASRVAELFKVQAANIEFRVDYEEGYALVESKPVRLDRLLAPEADTNAMRETFGAGCTQRADKGIGRAYAQSVEAARR
jgi:hypothetical protein